MKSEFLQLNYRPGKSVLYQGQKSPNAIAYKNGYNVTQNLPAKIDLMVYDMDDDIVLSEDITDLVRKILGWERITKVRIERLRTYLEKQQYICKNHMITNINEILIDAANKVI